MRVLFALCLLVRPAAADLFSELGCVACHAGLSDGPATPSQTAPDLRFEGTRVNRAWLVAYLRAPTPVRPSGYPVGSALYMPKQALSDAQVERLADALMARVAPVDPFTPEPLSAFATKKAERLLREKLSCLGCHRLGTEGGAIGPDLSSLSQRLKPSYVRAFLADPQAWLPATPMPKPAWRPGELDLVASYLLTQQIKREPPREMAAAPPSPNPDYQRYCAACHGAQGDGAGFNAKYLPVAPSKHADPNLGERADDTLYDGIAAGGAVLGKSHRMPGFGGTLSRARIRGLVAHLRSLCGCSQPDWARR